MEKENSEHFARQGWIACQETNAQLHVKSQRQSLTRPVLNCSQVENRRGRPKSARKETQAVKPKTGQVKLEPASSGTSEGPEKFRPPRPQQVPTTAELFARRTRFTDDSGDESTSEEDVVYTGEKPQGDTPGLQGLSMAAQWARLLSTPICLRGGGRKGRPTHSSTWPRGGAKYLEWEREKRRNIATGRGGPSRSSGPAQEGNISFPFGKKRFTGSGRRETTQQQQWWATLQSPPPSAT